MWKCGNVEMKQPNTNLKIWEFEDLKMLAVAAVRGKQPARV